jgi:hypothetical protein
MAYQQPTFIIYHPATMEFGPCNLHLEPQFITYIPLFYHPKNQSKNNDPNFKISLSNRQNARQNQVSGIILSTRWTIMAFTHEDAFWAQSGLRTGRPRKFYEPKEMAEACCSYFEWCDNNPHLEHKIAVVDKTLEEYSVPRKRVYTMSGLRIHLNISKQTWVRWKEMDNEEINEVIEWVEDVIHTQKFEGAVAGFFNANLIARDLGMSDKSMIGSDPDNPLPSPVSIFRIPENDR